MALSYEQAPTVAGSGAQEQGENLIFDSPEEARAFEQRVEGAMEAEGKRSEGVDRRKEAVGREVAAEFEREGEAVDIVREPWEHTREEHAEVQQLVNIAYQQDLRRALKQARASSHYPRNVDLLHDVLTNQMYEGLVAAGVNKQPLAGWIMGGLTLVLLIFTLVGLLLIAG